MRISLVLVCGMVVSLAAHGADEGLKPLKAALAPLRTTHGVNQERDAGPELTPVKHLLRAWIETQLSGVPHSGTPDGDAEAAQTLAAAPTEKRLNDAIEAEGLMCDASDPKSCTADFPEGPQVDDARGYIGDVSLSYLDDGRYLLVKTNIGVLCGYDESAYLYVWRDKGWHLLLESEQNDYRDKIYNPQRIAQVEVSPANIGWNEPAPPPLVMTLGVSPWCWSNWQAVYVRLWRASLADPDPKPLVDTSDTIYLGGGPRTVAGSITGHDAIIEYLGESVDLDVFVRPHVLHYAIEGDRAVRIGPVALSPADFVDEWLKRPWSESRQWTGARSQASARTLERQYVKFHAGGDYIGGAFYNSGTGKGTALRCRRDRSLWQVGFSLRDEKANTGPISYFLVRWEAPYRFTLLDIRNRAYSGCDETVAMPDALGTLFPLQGWRP